MRYNSTRVPLKVIQKIGDKTLVDRAIRLQNAVPEIDYTFLYGSCESIKKYITVPESKRTYQFIKRPIWLDGDAVSFNMVLDKALEENQTLLDADYIVFMTCTSPFLKTETLKDMISKIKHTKYDSAFTVTEHKIFAWFRGLPINYDFKVPIPKTQNLNPVWMETSSLYIFNLEYYRANKTRIGSNPYIKVVSKIEGLDIDTMDDFFIARAIVKGGDSI